MRFFWVKILLGAAVGALLLVKTAGGQDKPVRLKFDVATIRPTPEGAPRGWSKPLPSGMGYSVQNFPIKLLISLIYRVPVLQIADAPLWLSRENYDIEARTDRVCTHDELDEMLRSLLEERFGLKMHKITKEGPVFVLTVDKGGLKMKPAERGLPLAIPMLDGPDGTYVGTQVPMEYLCWWLALQLRADKLPVINKTGMDGSYDLTLSFAPIIPVGSSAEDFPAAWMDRPSIFEAVQQQLGLKLERVAKGPVESYVVDQVTRPTAN